MIVNVGVIGASAHPARPKRSFMTPFFPITPILGVLFCGYLIVALAGITWLVFGLWLLFGLVVYFLYGYRRSLLHTQR